MLAWMLRLCLATYRDDKMTDLTPSDVESDIKSFNSFSDDHVKQDMQLAELQAKSDQINDPQARKMAILAYTRHLLIVDQFQATGGVTNASVMGNSQAIANPNAYQNGDQYLQTYNKIASNFGNPTDQARMVTMNGLGNFDLF